MKPLNNSLRNKQLIRFYVAAGALVLLCIVSGILFSSSPHKITQQKYLAMLNDHRQMAAVTGNITDELQDVVAVEYAVSRNPATELDSIVEGLKERMETAIIRLSRDSGRLAESSVGEELQDLLAAYRAVLFYGNERQSAPEVGPVEKTAVPSDVDVTMRKFIADLRADNVRLQALVDKAPAGNGERITDNFKVQYEKEKLNTQRLQAQLIVLQQSAAGGSELQKKLATSLSRVADLESKLAVSEKENGQLNDKIKALEKVKPVTLDAEEKAKLVYQAIEKITSDKSSNDPLERVCRGLRRVLAEVKASHPSKDEVQGKISEIMKGLCRSNP